jgi:hypothetical protein
MALRKLKPTTPGQRGASVPDSQKSLAQHLRSHLFAQSTLRVVVTMQVASLFVTKVAVTSVHTVLSISHEMIRMVFQQRLHTLNTIQTAQRVSHFFTMQMEKSVTSSLQISLSKVQQLRTVQRPISSLVTTCHFATSQ